jgi:hypothetical protein
MQSYARAEHGVNRAMTAVKEKKIFVAVFPPREMLARVI